MGCNKSQGEGNATGGIFTSSTFCVSGEGFCFFAGAAGTGTHPTGRRSLGSSKGGSSSSSSFSSATDISSARMRSASGFSELSAGVVVVPGAAGSPVVIGVGVDGSVTAAVAVLAAASTWPKATMFASTASVLKPSRLAAAVVSSKNAPPSRAVPSVAGVAVAGVVDVAGVAAVAAASSSAREASSGCENSQSIAISIERPRTATSAARACASLKPISQIEETMVGDGVNGGGGGRAGRSCSTRRMLSATHLRAATGSPCGKPATPGPPSTAPG